MMNWSTTDLVTFLSKKDKEQKRLLIDLLYLNTLLLSDLTDEAKREVRDAYNEKINEYKKWLK
jgi:hypothetical protein